MNEEKLEEIKKKVSREGLYINRVPPKTRAEFIALAKEEFVGDYGFCLKHLIDFYKGLLTTPNEQLMEQIKFLSEEISQIKSVPQEKNEKKVIRSVSGRIIRRE